MLTNATLIQISSPLFLLKTLLIFEYNNNDKKKFYFWCKIKNLKSIFLLYLGTSHLVFISVFFSFRAKDLELNEQKKRWLQKKKKLAAKQKIKSFPLSFTPQVSRAKSLLLTKRFPDCLHSKQSYVSLLVQCKQSKVHFWLTLNNVLLNYLLL